MRLSAEQKKDFIAIHRLGEEMALNAVKKYFNRCTMPTKAELYCIYMDGMEAVRILTCGIMSLDIAEEIIEVKDAVLLIKGELVARHSINNIKKLPQKCKTKKNKRFLEFCEDSINDGLEILEKELQFIMRVDQEGRN